MLHVVSTRAAESYYHVMELTELASHPLLKASAVSIAPSSSPNQIEHEMKEEAFDPETSACSRRI